MSLLKIAVRKLPPSQRSGLGRKKTSLLLDFRVNLNNHYVKVVVIGHCWRMQVMLISQPVFYACLPICRFVKGNVCRKFAHCFVSSVLKSVQTSRVSFDSLPLKQKIASERGGYFSRCCAATSRTLTACFDRQPRTDSQCT